MTDHSTTSGARVVNEKESVLARPATRALLILVAAAGLAVDAYVHLHLAPNFDSLVSTATPHISQGQLFRVEGASALVALLLLLATRHRLAAGLAFLVTAGGLAAVLLYAYVHVGELGPLPDMYDPTWSAEKTASAVAEGLAAVAALALLRRPRP